MRNQGEAKTETIVLNRYLPLWAALILIGLCAIADPRAGRMAGGELAWKVVYALFLIVSLLILTPYFEKYLARWLPRFSVSQRNDGWNWFDVIACTYTFCPLMQLLVFAPRPPGTSLAHLNGFPSGHQFSTVALSWMVWKYHPRLAPWWFGASAIIGWARIETQDHYAYQVLGGALLGALLGWWKTRHTEGVFLPRMWHWWQRRQLKMPDSQLP